MENKKRLAINMIATLIAFAVNMGINFFLSPYVISNVGIDAYGFVTLANNFVMYASLITIALNSMASRFITVELYRNNKEEANKYFSSVLIANKVISLFLIIPMIITIIFLDKLLNIPEDLTTDVKLLFGLIFFNFIINIINSTYSVATFVKNRLDLSSKRNIEVYILKAVLLLLLFSLLVPKLFYIGLATCLTSIYLLLWNVKYTKELLPEIEISKENFEFKKILEILKSGVWNTITKLGQTLTDGLDLLICNLFITSEAMGQLSVAKMFSGIVSNLMIVVYNIFSPQLTMYYAKNEISKLVQELKLSMKVTGCFANIPLTYLVVFGAFFYTTWIPNQDINLISILTILTVQGEIVSGVITPMFNMFTITNKVKVDAIVRLINGFVTIFIVFLFVKFTDYGIYAVAGTSIILAAIINFTFVPIYVAKYCLNLKWYAFYPLIFRYIITNFVLILVVYFAVKPFFVVSNWTNIIISVVVVGLVGVLINAIMLFDKKERTAVIGLIKDKLIKKA